MFQERKGLGVMSRRNDSKVYVGNLPPDTRQKDIEELFDKYGRVVSVELKDRMDPPFAFVEFGDPRSVQCSVTLIGLLC